jgi:hypothetical protein
MAANGDRKIDQNWLRRQKVLCNLQREVGTIDLGKKHFVATLPQRFGRRTPTRQAHLPPTVRW